MKSNTLVTALFVLFTFSDLIAQRMQVEWPALEDFHTVIAAISYPAEKGNLTPLRTRSQELVTKAALLNKSTIPAKLPKVEMRKVMKLVLSETRTINKLVKKNSSDRVLIQKLNALQGHFQQLLDLCKKDAP